MINFFKNNSLSFIKYAILLMAFFPLLPNRIKGLPLIILLLIAIVYFFQEKKRIFNWNLFLFNSIIYIIYLMSLLYTANINYAFKKLETALGLLLYPLVFSLLWNSRLKIDNRKLLNNFITLLYWSVFTYSFITFAFLFNKGLIKYFNDSNFFRYYTEFLPIIGQHSIYASIFLALGLLSSIYLIHSKLKTFIILCILLGDVVMTLLLIFLASKGVLLALFITIIFFLTFQLKRTIKIIRSVTALSILLVLSIVYSPPLSKRFNLFIHNFQSTNTITYEQDLSSTQIRIEIYKCSVNQIKKNWLTGCGYGDVNDDLKKCYSDINRSLYLGNYNSHNQYFSVFLGTGIVGFLLFLLFLLFNYKVAFKNNNYLYFSILLLYSIIMLFENLLERQSGILLFTFLINFLYYIVYQDQK